MSIALPRRRRVVLWNAAFGYCTLAVTLARNILLVPLYLKFIEFGEYGAWLATGGALVQLLVTDYGLAGVVTQRVAVLSGGADQAGMRATIMAGLVNAVLLAILLTGASSLIAAFPPATAGLSAAQVRRVIECFLIAITANGLGVIGATATAALRGLQKPVTAGAITLTADLASIAATVICLLAHLGLYALALALLMRSVFITLSGLAALAPLLFARAQRTRLRWADSLALWRQAGRFFVTSIAMRLQTQANTLVVGVFLGPQVAATYGLSVRAHEMVLIVLWQINAAIGPALAHLVGAGQQGRLDGIIRNMLPLVAAVAAVGSACAIVLNESFVGLWVGAHAFAGMAVTVLMGLALWISAVSSVGYEALIARGEFALIARVYGGASVLHVAVVLTLVHFGPWAAPLALCLSTCTWGTLLWYRVLTDMGVSRRGMLSVAREPLQIFAAAALATAAFAYWLPRADSWATFIGEAALVAGVVVLLLLLLRPRLRELLRSELVTTLRALRAT